MKYLHVISRMDPELGGVSQAVRTMVTGLTGLGIQSEVVSLDAPDAAFLNSALFPIHAVGPATGPWQYSLHLAPWLMANLQRFDVVLLHGLWLYHGYAVRQALKRCKTQFPDSPTPQLFVMPHGMLDPYFQRAEGRQLKAARNWAYWKLIESQLIQEAAGVMFTCEAERDLAAQSFRPYRPRRELVVGLGVEEPPAYTAAMRNAFRRACPELQDQPYLLFLSRIHEKKGVDLLVQAYAELTSKAVHAREFAGSLAGADADYTGTIAASYPHLVIAGPGLDTPYGQSIQQTAQALNRRQPTVSFTGMLTGDAKWGAFYGCEAFVLPSHQENFGIAVVEAMACGKPVLISNQVNIWQEIEAAGGGLVEEDTRAGTRSLLQQWGALSGHEKMAFGEQARVAYSQEFAVAAAASKLVNAVTA
ncbi:glycosyltransferase [Hymenobacter wooponensis]|uniref:Glycosyltransferase n=1 Tax=Hymenobacter wooponensis TaxID=1525360 RepID=A0A4Z0MRC5_9BACT|nr:glycosyltransferase [Hymenobacter wooponensis]TGD82231.1 glycosyltransferase [Hymenobacter wooponensis]